MGTVVVRYKVKPEHAEENQQLIENVYAELAETDPGGLRYTTFRLEDGVTFVHIASIEAEDGANPLAETSAFQVFQHGITERCDEQPAFYNANMVGSYRVFDA